MNITDSVNSVLIIDDKKDEVEGLIEVLKKNDIYYLFYNPEDEDSPIPRKNRQIIFCDLYLNSTTTKLTGNIALLRKTLKKIATPDFGSYGIVLWTKHTDEITQVMEKLSIDQQEHSYNVPLFIVDLDKQDYLEENSFDNIWTDLSKKLENNTAAYFFFNWRASVNKGADKALADVYSLSPDYQEQSKYLTYLLSLLAVNYSGVDLHGEKVYDGMYKDAYKAFDELLSSDLALMQAEDKVDIFSQILSNPRETKFNEELDAIGRLNAKLLIETTDLHQERNLPGSVYEVTDSSSLLYIPDEKVIKSDLTRIAIELTPPCDFAHKKVHSRLVGGFIADIPTDTISTKKQLDKFIDQYSKKGAEYSYSVCPIYYNGGLKLCCFDFRYLCGIKNEDLQDSNKFKLLFIAKDKFFADVLQKFSSHASRLGLSMITP
ncbi:MAG: hypothetical protein K6A82_07690 [Prevotella sp.]|nr:hypothetical protein [Prevotella sp.]